MITYNITFKGEHNHYRNKDLSYVQIGQINKQLEPYIAYTKAFDDNKYWNQISFAQI